MSHVKAYSTKCSLQSLKVMMCPEQGGVSVGVYAVIQSDSCDTCNKVITVTKLNMLPLPCSYVCVDVSSHSVLQYSKSDAGTIWAVTTSSMHLLLYFCV